MPEAQPSRSGARGEVRIEQPSRQERVLGLRAAEARATVPDLELGVEVDMQASWPLRRHEANPAGASVTAILLRACAPALRETPRANGAYRDGHFELYSRVNVGVTVGAPGSSVIATVFDADRKSLAELSAELDALGRRARDGALTPPELTGSTFALSNPGALGVTSASAIVHPHHAGALAAGAVRHAPVVHEGAVVPGLLMHITLACDQRILSGDAAAGFLSAVTARLEAPEV